MKITFFSNHLTHHQLPLCEELYKTENIEFFFVADLPLPAERLTLGYEDLNAKYPFVICAYKGEEYEKKAYELANESDVVIAGSNSEKYISKRLKEKKLIFCYSERIMKTPIRGLSFLKYTIAQRHIFARKPSVYLLAASAFASLDYNKFGLFKNKSYKWGYFPEVYKYDSIDTLIDQKEKNSILWCGRIIDWKHPELAVEVAKKLKSENKEFKMHIIGCGDLEEKIKADIVSLKLQDCVVMHGSMSPENVRKYMEKSEIFIFTSDRNEGWGAVLNEAMNSACAVVASHMIGAVPFMIENGENGLIFKDGYVTDLYEKVVKLLDDAEKRNSMGIKAYQSMIEVWNAETAAKRLLILSDRLLQNPNSNDVIFENGPCSRAEILQEDMHS